MHLTCFFIARVYCQALFRDYITLYVTRAKDDQIHRLAVHALGLDEAMLREMMALHVTEDNAKIRRYRFKRNGKIFSTVKESASLRSLCGSESRFHLLQ